MKIYTSYYGGYRGGSGVSISLYPPKFWKEQERPRIEAFCPTYAIFKNNDGSDDYTRKFKAHLEALGWKGIDALNKLIAQANIDGKDHIALLCYEKPDDFCHRHLVAGYLRANGYKVEEWVRPTKKTPPVKPDPPQLVIFDGA